MIVCALFASTWSARAATQDDDFMAARDAFRSGDSVRLERYAKSLNGYPLEPYVAYWRLKLRLDDAAPAEVQATLERLADGPISNTLRIDWLKQLAIKQRWDLFDAEYPQVVGEDADLLCWSLQGRMRAGGAEALSYARTLWFSGREPPESRHAGPRHSLFR